MYLIVQTNQITLQCVTKHAQRLHPDAKSTASYQEALDIVRQRPDKTARLVVISSNVFKGSEQYMTGALFAKLVKEVDPNAWFFLYSTEPSKAAEFDGYIPKDTIGYKLRVPINEFFEADVEKLPSIEEVRKRLPWL